jgi:hypothetical protein
MVDANEFVKLEEGQKDELDFKLATVTELFETGTAKIIFYGEDVASEKEYAYLASYEPVIGDIVLTVPFADSYIIIGRLLFKQTLPEEIEITMDDVNGAITEALTTYAKTSDLSAYVQTTALSEYVKTSQLSTYAKTSDLSNYSPTSHTHTSVKSSSYTAGLDLIFNGYPALIPSSSNMCLGASSNARWNTVYAVTGTINTSDKRQKKFIKSISEKYLGLFEKLRPVTYKFKKNQSDRIHLGFVAQEVEDAMSSIGMDSKEFAGFIKAPIRDKGGNIIDYEYGLRYSEFIALNSYMIQQLMKKIDKLSKRIEKLERKSR